MQRQLAENLAVVLHGKDDLRVEKRPIPTPSKDEVLVEIKNVGICGSDVHFLSRGNIGSFDITQPFVLGHESSGQVIKVGEDVKHLKPGDRVTIEPGVSCGKCANCKLGRYNLCSHMIFSSAPPVDGNMCRYKVHSADFCFKVPDHVSYEEAAMLEPLTVAVYSVQRGRVKMGDYVLVTGAGPIGLLCMLVAKAAGAGYVIITDIAEGRLNIAKKLGADYIVNVNGKGLDDVIKEIRSQRPGEEPNVCLECTGSEAATRLAIEVTAPGGVLTLVGMGPNLVSVPLITAGIRELDILGIYRYANCYPTALALVASGKVDVKPLITHRYKLEQAVEAFEMARNGKENAIKVMFNCN